MHDCFLEGAPNSVRYHDPREHAIEDCEVRILIIKGGMILFVAIIHVFNPEGPAAIILPVLMLVVKH